MRAGLSVLLSAAALASTAATFTRPMERVTTLEPAKVQSLYDARAVQLVYETPLAVDYAARPYRVVPGCCEMPVFATNGLTCTVRLRNDRPMLTAADVVRALELLRDPKDVSPNGWLLEDVGTIRAADARTVEISFKRPLRHFNWLLTQPAVAVKTSAGEGTGPYRLVSWRKNHEMTFIRRMPSAQGFDTVRYLTVEDMSTQWLMFLRGELDMLGEISRENWDIVVDAAGKIDPALAAKGVRLFETPMLDSIYFGVNMADPVLGPNRALRQALNCAFDRAAWVRFTNGRVIPSDGPVPPGVPERLETPFAYGFDLEKARRLLVEAGYPGGIDPKTGRRLTLSLAIGRATQESRESGELTAAFFERVGIRLTLDFMAWDAFLKAVNEGRVQLFRIGWVGDYPDAQNFLQLFHSKNVSPGCNHTNYRNAAFDAAYARGDWRTCQEIVREDCPWIFVNYNKSYSLTGARVGNYRPGAFPAGTEQFYENLVP